MKIKNVIIRPVTPNNGLVEFASITLGDDIALNSIAIYRKLDGSGYRLVYPTKSQMKMKYVFHPLTRKMSKEIEQAIFFQKSLPTGRHLKSSRVYSRTSLGSYG